MSHETMLTPDELDQMDDISGSALMRAEAMRIPRLTPIEKDAYIEAARAGSEQARNELICDCLNWTMMKAQSTYQDRQPVHSDLMDLVGHAHVTLLETFPKALQAEQPIKYLMSVAAIEMKLYCTYDDPMIRRTRNRPVKHDHPLTVSIDPNMQLAANETHGHMPEAEYQLVYNAVHEISEQRREVLKAVYGLFGESTTSVEDIARMLNIKKETAQGYIYRARATLAEKLGPLLVSSVMNGEGENAAPQLHQQNSSSPEHRRNQPDTE